MLEKIIDHLTLDHGVLGIAVAILLLGNYLQWKAARKKEDDIAAASERREAAIAAERKEYMESFHEIAVQSATAMTELSTLIRDLLIRGRT